MDLEALLNAADNDIGDWEVDADTDHDEAPLSAHLNDEEEMADAIDDLPATGDQSVSDGRMQNAYVSRIADKSGLHILTSSGLFFSATYRDTLRGWRNARLLQIGKAEVTVAEFEAFMGLEVAMGILPLTEIKDFWSKKNFLGQKDVAETMPRNRFECLRANIQLHAPNSATESYKLMNPLWHSRDLLRHIQGQFAEIAVPTGAASFDESTVRAKARSLARTYMPSKPGKYGIRFYAVMGWDSLYIHTINDNGSGNTEPRNPAERFCGMFHELRRPLARTLAREDISVKRDSASALWVAMIGRMTLTHQSPTGRRLIVCNNYYTRHELAKAVLAFTDGEVRMVGTCKVNQMGKWNESEIALSVERVKLIERGSWELIAAVDIKHD
ncbi:Transposase IS4 [Phytophthora infestans]|uniref:Transposase IS4 n=1 Tax=Phytophthora infestans TaxID=4787 RepID=A0A8S9UYC8_PHYIN|nr:Transposase IS4 [Phytophthora infestans]